MGCGSSRSSATPAVIATGPAAAPAAKSQLQQQQANRPEPANNIPDGKIDVSHQQPTLQPNLIADSGNIPHNQPPPAKVLVDGFGHQVDENGGRVWSAAYYAARKEADMYAVERGKCFENSKQAFSEVSLKQYLEQPMLLIRHVQQNRKAEAKTLSDEGKRHGDRMNKANEKAAAEILTPQNLTNSTSIDLHGLLVQEAVDATKSFIVSKVNSSQAVLTVVTGQGHHSDKVKGAVIKPAILQMLSENKWQFEIDEKNPGCIHVRL
jgi:DNA-nicking Smr family endonuclease